jgi:hypothetical protein
MKKELPDCIKEIISGLNSHRELTNDTVAEIVGSAGVTLEAVSDFTLFDHGAELSYGRKSVYECDKYKVLLMTWCPGDFTAIHNHGATEWGAVLFLGTTTHRLYEIKNGTLSLSGKHLFKKGQIVGVTGSLTHIMGNSGREPVASLHIYGTNTVFDENSDDAKVYSPEHNKCFSTDGSAFLIMDKELINAEEPFDSISNDARFDYYELIKSFYKRNKRTDVLLSIERFEKEKVA